MCDCEAREADDERRKNEYLEAMKKGRELTWDKQKVVREKAKSLTCLYSCSDEEESLETIRKERFEKLKASCQSFIIGKLGCFSDDLVICKVCFLAKVERRSTVVFVPDIF